MTMVHPAASAGAIFHTPIISGKFHGTIAPTTPTGSMMVMAWCFAPGGTGMETLIVAPSIFVAQPA
ncbi:hypothetical protein MAUB1S_10671 [Mycolicibacterium aubagnense]